MKKSILVLLFLSGSAVAFSQSVSFGVKAGLNIAKQKASTQGFTISTDSKADFLGGVYLTAMFNDKFGVQPELLYSGQGGKFNDGTTTQTSNFAYLNIPVLLRYQIIPMLNVHAGPQFGVLMSAKSGGTDIKSDYKSSDVGIAFGAGVDLPVGINFGVRYVAGVANIAKDSGNASFKNETIQITVGYKLFGK